MLFFLHDSQLFLVNESLVMSSCNHAHIDGMLAFIVTYFFNRRDALQPYYN